MVDINKRINDRAAKACRTSLWSNKKKRKYHQSYQIPSTGKVEYRYLLIRAALK
jgi:hypothetical protein